MKNKRLWRDISVNKLGRVMVLVHGTSSYYHLSRNKIPLQSLLYCPRYGLDRQQLWKIVKGR